MDTQRFEINCGFFNSINNDRLYMAEDQNRPYRRLVSDGVFATQKGTPSTDLQVVANNGMNILVKKGEGIVDQKWFENPTDLNVTIQLNSNVVPRIDSIIIGVDNNQEARIGYIAYRQGTPASSPTAPDLVNDENITEYRLANLSILPNTSAITQDLITDLRGSNECPWVTHLLYQVDTSTLYEQYRAAYQKYYDDETELFNNFMQQLTEELTVNTSVIQYQSRFVVSNDNTTEIIIDVPDFDSAKDVLIVFKNGLKLSQTVDYTISEANDKIIFTENLSNGDIVDTLILKSVILGDTEEVLTAVGGISEKVNALQAEISEINENLIFDTTVIEVEEVE